MKSLHQFGKQIYFPVDVIELHGYITCLNDLTIVFNSMFSRGKLLRFRNTFLTFRNFLTEIHASIRSFIHHWLYSPLLALASSSV
jgi:hypothetical protein